MRGITLASRKPNSMKMDNRINIANRVEASWLGSFGGYSRGRLSGRLSGRGIYGQVQSIGSGQSMEFATLMVNYGVYEDILVFQGWIFFSPTLDFG